jgi:hypothetical protein
MFKFKVIFWYVVLGVFLVFAFQKAFSPDAIVLLTLIWALFAGRSLIAGIEDYS